LFLSRCDYLDEEDFLGGLFNDPKLEMTLEAFKDIVHELISKDTINSFETSPICTAMRMRHKSEPRYCEGWKEIIRRLLTFGPDLHGSYPWGGGTILEHVLNIAEWCPFESQQVGEEWLEILGDAGFDIEDYIRIEELHQYKFGSVPILLPLWSHGGIKITDNIRHRCIIFSDHKPRISWNWYINPEGHAFEVLYEFRNLGPIDNDYDPAQDYHFPEEIFNWPFFHPRWERSHLWWHLRTDEMVSPHKVFRDRFERRWLKKIKKLEKTQGIGRGLKIPGAWVD
jgi:hypothetical protein